MFNFGDAVREPSGPDQLYSLYSFLEQNPPDGPATIQQMHISPISAPTARTYEGGLEQAFFSERLIFRTSFFHNEFGKQIEYVGLDLIPELLPNLTPEQQQQLCPAAAGGRSVRADAEHPGLPRDGCRSHGGERDRRGTSFCAAGTPISMR